MAATTQPGGVRRARCDAEPGQGAGSNSQDVVPMLRAWLAGTRRWWMQARTAISAMPHFKRVEGGKALHESRHGCRGRTRIHDATARGEQRHRSG